MVFLLIAALAEACRRHLDVSLQRFGRSGDILAALMVMFWAYQAHTRYTFRDWRPPGQAEGLLRFLAASWACLAAEAAGQRLAPLAAEAVWLFATLLSFVLAREWIWEAGKSSALARTA